MYFPGIFQAKKTIHTHGQRMRERAKGKNGWKLQNTHGHAVVESNPLNVQKGRAKQEEEED